LSLTIDDCCHHRENPADEAGFLYGQFSIIEIKSQGQVASD
jgi:hypothetical protein